MTEGGAHLDADTSSLFRHEDEAINAIVDQVVAGHLGQALPNLELHDDQSNRYFETDLILVAPFGIYVIELKHWSGLIQVRPNSWLQNGSFYKEDPHKANGFKAKLLRGLYERQFPHFPHVFVESVVVLTNPEATVEGAHVSSTEKRNPTFAGVGPLISYLKRQRSGGGILKDQQVESFVGYLRKIHTTAPPRDFVFPGYEIVERLSHHEDRAELIARRTDLRHRQLSRLRIFFPRGTGPEQEMRAAQERARATLNAVAKIGEHPNILKVWSVPNENSYIVEGSDWSETGTLRDVIADRGPLDTDAATGIATGLLRGLDAIHAQCVIHRALSPENVLMVGDTAKLTNFDLSYQLEEDRATVIPDASKLTRSPYIAPEVYRCGPLSESADLFSVGVILYEMLLGERPFDCSTDLERTDGHLGDLQREKLSATEEHLGALIADLIQLEPDRRPDNALDVLERLVPGASQPAEVNPQLGPGACSGLYEIQGLVARGVQAQIYRAFGPRASRVALKLFNADVPLERVVREYKLAAAVHHPAVVEVDTYGCWEDGRFYIAFEWLEGQRLRDEIIAGKLPGLERFGFVASRMLEAVGALHAYSDEDSDEPILHNDIKPDNAMLMEGDRAVLIDFGSASRPHVGLYEGTEGYVAPDLRLGQDRNYCKDGDIFALGVTLFEWFFGELPDAGARAGSFGSLEDERLREHPLLSDWFARAVAPNSVDRFTGADEMMGALATALSATPAVVQPPPPVVLEPQPVQRWEPADRNAFVEYLNSLHSRDAANENALAEAQARNELFRFVHVDHPVTAAIGRALLGNARQHVVLTGHAGDGKSTIAIELYKRLTDHAANTPLERDLEPREDIQVGANRVAIIKDFSEWPLSERLLVLEELAEADGPRFLLVSNTGTMLGAFSERERRAGGDWSELESRILGLISQPAPEPMEFGGSSIAVVNLSMIENLSVAERLLGRMLDGERWEQCRGQSCSERCPIYRNVELMRANEAIIRERMFLAYRRMHEYGTRLTLRQLSAHLAYMITSGLSCSGILQAAERSQRPLMSDFAFFNRFFGDNGRDVDGGAQQLRAIRAVREQGFGAHPCPSWERRIWLHGDASAFAPQADGCKEEFERLRQLGLGRTAVDGLTQAQARQQVRRMLFFLHRGDPTEDEALVGTFLNSKMIVSFVRWQRSEANLSRTERIGLERSVLHVLQEHFTGVRLPEGSRLDPNLYITLSRRSHEVRQSAQIVLAHFPENHFELRLRPVADGFGGTRRELVLTVRSERAGTQLLLELPFLDYVMMRQQGEVGQYLQTSHVDRLEKFKGALLAGVGCSRGDDGMLVRLRTNHTFRRQIYAVDGERLEVFDD